MPKENEKTVLTMTITTWTTIVDGVAYFFMQCPVCGASNGIPLDNVIEIIEQHQGKKKTIKKLVYVA